MVTTTPPKLDLQLWRRLRDAGLSEDEANRLVMADLRQRLTEQAPEMLAPAPAQEPAGEPRIIASPRDPLPNARQFVEELFVRDGVRTLHHQQDVWLAWDGTCYRETEAATIRSKPYEWLEGAVWLDSDGQERPWQPARGHVENILDAVKAVAHLPKTVQAPAWLGEPGPYPADELIACKNGLLHIPTRALLAHDPRLFHTWALPFEFDPAAPAPTQWLDFLRQLWDDDEAINTLQEAMGYTLTPDTTQHKAFLLAGPPRCGKSTIGRVWRQLVGPANVAGPTLSSLATNFGLAGSASNA